jgi:hypothetical protein
MVGVPTRTTLPPVEVPAAVVTPALSVTAVDEVLVVLMLSLKVRSPVSVLIETSPVDQIPVGLTVPIVSALLSTYEMAPTLLLDEPAAIVPMAFEVFVSVVEPAPRRARLDEVIAADWVTAVEAVIDKVFDVAVTGEFSATVPP